jgi:hypothetical protein
MPKKLGLQVAALATLIKTFFYSSLNKIVRMAGDSFVQKFLGFAQG